MLLIQRLHLHFSHSGLLGFGVDVEEDADGLAVVDGVGAGVGDEGGYLVLGGGQVGAVHQRVPDGNGDGKDDDYDRQDGDHLDEGETAGGRGNSKFEVRMTKPCRN